MEDGRFAEDIEEVVAGETIDAVVIGDHGGNFYERTAGTDGYLTPTDARFIPVAKRHVVLSWAEARPLLDYEYDSGYGLCDCHPVWVWTPTRLLFVHEYDGSTHVGAMPRHPVDGIPETC